MRGFPIYLSPPITGAVDTCTHLPWLHAARKRPLTELTAIPNVISGHTAKTRLKSVGSVVFLRCRLVSIGWSCLLLFDCCSHRDLPHKHAISQFHSLSPPLIVMRCTVGCETVHCPRCTHGLPFVALSVWLLLSSLSVSSSAASNTTVTMSLPYGGATAPRSDEITVTSTLSADPPDGDACFAITDEAICGAFPLCTWSPPSRACVQIACEDVEDRTQCRGNWRCSFDALTQQCRTVPCANFSANVTKCSNSRHCVLQPLSLNCVNAPCNHFGVAEECERMGVDICQWQAATGTCATSNVSCPQRYDSPSCTRAGCRWSSTSSACQFARCQDFPAAVECRAGGIACAWTDAFNICTALPCSDYYQMTGTCRQDRCQFGSNFASANASACYPIRCTNFTAAQCPPARCVVDNDLCKPVPCDGLDLLTCDTNRCVWDPSSASCEPLPCAQWNISTSCVLEGCSWDAATKSCSLPACDRYVTEAVCPTDRCSWAATGCVDLACSLRQGVSVCNQKASCAWTAGTCGDRGCHAIGDESTCASTGRCRWNATWSRCLRTTCGTTTVNTTCLALGCLWNELLRPRCHDVPCEYVRVRSACPSDMCVWSSDTNTCADVPCDTLLSEGNCGQFGSRCAWAGGQTPSSRSLRHHRFSAVRCASGRGLCVASLLVRPFCKRLRARALPPASRHHVQRGRTVL
jgi:hypothetical protein